MTRGKVWATAAFLLGIAVSVAANVAHTYHPGRRLLADYARTHQGHVDGWRPEIGSQIGAAFYPLALLLTVELLSRINWPAGWQWAAARLGGAGLVAAVSAVVSYRHMAGLLHAYGEDSLTSAIGPLAVDGLMVVASMALLAVGRAGADVNNINVVPLVDPKTIELFPTDPPAEEQDQAVFPEPFPDTPAHLESWLAGKVTEEQSPGAEENTVPAGEEQEITEARNRFRDVLDAGSVPSIRTIKRELRVGYPKAKEIRAVLSGNA